ncbi:His/Gly/Thr/Pro-type tRNA ligase C-terminal domain-containing protein [Bradyrhizobium sp. 2S1]|uniref:His/Gly/Thr/Pro-type tRNA ligase C-terminal domain-containing protein n=1 Tax=Bradyrhizobium sp. 2S1 TaxID=1404429 RepID=UPI00289F2C82|nr:His/Gly/Thr/Pro-type tRNA ligase C-terminal domain-containing protein [Bradyrhizobium sp. 2S1]
MRWRRSISQEQAAYGADVKAAFEDAGIRAVDYDGADTLSRRIVAAHDMAVPVMAIVGRREMREGRVTLRERDGAQADMPLADAVSRLQARARPGAVMAEALKPADAGPKRAGARIRGSSPVGPLRTCRSAALPDAFTAFSWARLRCSRLPRAPNAPPSIAHGSHETRSGRVGVPMSRSWSQLPGTPFGPRAEPGWVSSTHGCKAFLPPYRGSAPDLGSQGRRLPEARSLLPIRPKVPFCGAADRTQRSKTLSCVHL